MTRSFWTRILENLEEPTSIDIEVSKHPFNIGRARVGERERRGRDAYSRQILILVVPVKGRERC